ncbi:sugar ABC transporter permease [Rathayibacter sp. VKM Ac-2835]|uniref:carbohydrate ABC transporter permease n=1 Tax=Rathayibacter sp. VKM Ac-2835 TaxID=2739043 RepID=UPI001565C857|nr:sugar ABC transporter permease [Rathayibacter sp. VKM Ac-2835]NRG42252.1 sugar ABC transporter permease [Rathayibacter sp. VKM Ac-2835]
MAITDAPPLEVGASKRAGGGRRGDRPSGRRQRLTGRRSTPWLFLAVPLAFLVVLTYIPVANMFWYSVTDWDGLDQDKTFVGLENYVEIFTRPEIFQVFFVSLFYLAGAVAQLGLALFFATLLSFQTRFRNFFKGVIFFPYLINGVAIGLMFLYFFRPDGTLDAVLGAFGVQDTPQWLGDPSVVNVSLAATSVWRYMGLNFVLFLGAIQSVPEEQYEAADIDGATSFDKFRYIIVPSIRRILGLSFILAIAGALSAFEMPYIMTGGANGSETFVIQTVDTAFRYSKVGLASAMAVVLLAIVLIITAVQRRVFPDEKAGQE